MIENNKTMGFLQKLAPCIERGDLDACAREMGVGELLDLSVKIGGDEKYAKKQGMDFVKEEKIERHSVNKWLIGVLAAIVLGIISNRLFSWDIDLKIFRFFRSLFFGADIP